MLERFTQKARAVVVGAQEEARTAGHSYVGTEHLLAAMAALGDGAAYHALSAVGLTAEVVREEIGRRVGGVGRLSEGDAEALRTIGIDLDAVVASVEKSFGPGALDAPSSAKSRGHRPFTKRAKKVMELALREALRLGHSYIGTEHLLLGLIRENDGLAMQIMRDRGIDLAAVQSTLNAEMPAGRPAKRRTALAPSPATQHILGTAATEARREGRRYVGTGQLLVALVGIASEQEAGPFGLAAAALLADAGITVERIRAAVDDVKIEGRRPFSGSIGFGDHLSTDAKGAIKRAQTLSALETRTGTEPAYLLMSLAMTPGSTAATLLVAAGLTPKEIRNRLLGPLDGGVLAAA